LRTAVRCLTVGLLCVGPITASGQTPTDTSRILTAPLISTVYGNTRTIRAYLPPSYYDPANAQRKYPVLLMGDGFAVFSPRSWNAPALLDSLINARAVTPLIMIGIDNAASIPGVANPGQARADEYLPYIDALEPELKNPQGQRYPDLLWNEVLPLVQSRFRIDTAARNVALGGSSYSAIAALYAAIATGQRFGGLLLESPPVFMFNERLIADVSGAGKLPDRIYVGIGTAETADTVILQKGANAIRRLVAAVQAKGAAAQLNEVVGATHDSKAWRARLPRALEFLFPIQR
jgi:enterochelin esterase-like enzyme